MYFLLTKWTLSFQTKVFQQANKYTIMFMKHGVLIWWACQTIKFQTKKNFRCLFVFVDSFSNFTWCIPLKNKNAQTIQDEFS